MTLKKKKSTYLVIHTSFFHFSFQLLNLLDVIIDKAESKQSSNVKSDTSVSEHPSGPQLLTSDAEMNTESGGTTVVGTSTKTVDSAVPSTSGADNECDAQTVLLNLPQAELRLLCSLLAREGYEYVLLFFCSCYVSSVMIIFCFYWRYFILFVYLGSIVFCLFFTLCLGQKAKCVFSLPCIFLHIDYIWCLTF